jgi:hypothetical protein
VEKFPSRERANAAAIEARVTAVVVARAIEAGGVSRSALDLCLRGALAEPWIDELVVVDLDNTPEVSSALRAFQLDRRDTILVAATPGAGMAAAANVGANAARGRWLLFLDPDVVLQRGAVARMAAAGGEARAPWIVGGRLTHIDGRDRRVARVGTLNAFSSIAVALGMAARPPRPRRGAESQATQVSAVSGAFMMVAREDFWALGGFDEGFLGEAADLDLCRRTAQAGGSVWFQPEATGVQFARHGRQPNRRIQGLARFAAKSASSPLERVFASVAGPALVLLVGLRDFIAGQPRRRR